ncbi:WD40 repeat-like protein [Ramaria rubella]|nr:WD40 repeat-like protein [Ramaria rubella]
MDRRRREQQSSTVLLPMRGDARHASAHQRRKQTLLTLLDALNELNSQGLDQDSSNGTTLVDDEPEGPSADDQLQTKGAEAFNRFQRCVQQLDKELQNFANAVRQLGSSVGILSSSFHLRQRLAQILFLFRENAADLFPRKVQREHHHELNKLHSVKSRIRQSQSRRKGSKTPTVARPTVQNDLKPGDFPEELELLAHDVTTFLECLNEFPEFTDEAVNASIMAFEGDLKYWASCLRDFKDQFRFPAVERYVHDLSGEMGNHIEAITSTIGVFVEVGVPTIRFAQKHTATNLLNLSTVATFFSAVTATTIQFSFNLNDNPLQNAVNAFWFSSLVFSIASAVNSLLGLTWKQAMYRSPRHRVPWWVLIWIKRSPLIFLVISVAAFSVGLVLFTWASTQHLTTCLVTSVFTGFSSFGLVAVSAWFAFERVTYTRHKGKRWLADILADINSDIRKYTGLEWAGRALPRHADRARQWSGTHATRLARKGTELVRASSRVWSTLSIQQIEENIDVNEDILPLPNMTPATLVAPPRRVSLPHRPSETDSVRAESIGTTTKLTEASAAPVETKDDAQSPTTPQRLTGKGRFAGAVRSVIMLQNASTTSSPIGTSRKLTGLSAVVGALQNSSSPGVSRRGSSEPFTAAKLSRIILLSHSLKNLEITETLPAHQALVRHLQFSPDGKWLATCSWDRTSVLFRVGNGESFNPHRTLAHPQGFVYQVAWSPKGGYLLTKLHRSVKVWTEDGVCTKTIERHRAVQSVTWSFLSVEGSEVNEVDLTGKILASYRLPRLALHDVAVTPDQQRMLGVATLIESPDGLQPHKARKEKRIIVYNLIEKEIESQVPVMHNVRDITIACNGQLALVSYEDKAPPQLWRMDRVADDVRLSLRHTYMPNADVDFAGTSYFGGKDDQLILCAGKNGHIHIWDRESATLLHDLRVPEGDLTGIAWNTAFDTPMFATGSHDGAVKIWASALQQPLVNNPCSPSASRSNSGLPSRSDSPSYFVESPMLQEFGILDGPLSRKEV